MKRIRQKLFILNYLGSLLLITATFVPIVKFNNQEFAFIDQFFYLSFAIVILSTITLILATMKKFKLSLIPTILNIVIIVYGIYDILNIDGIKSTPDFSYGVAFIIYPIGAILNIIGGLLATGKTKKKKDKITKEEKISFENNNTLEIEEPHDITEESPIDLDPYEQIPISNLINKSNFVDIQDDIVDSKSVNSYDEKFNFNDEEIKLDTIEQDDIQDNSLDIEVQDNKEMEIAQDSIEIARNEENTIQNSEQNNTQDFESVQNVENISILSEDDDMLEEIEEYEYNGDEFFEEINEEDISNHNDERITIPSIEEAVLIDDIEDTQVSEHSKNEINLDVEIPDIDLNNENIMTNNTQIEDAPKPEFMALNPSDIKIDNKKPLFRKKEKKEENPLERIMKRNIPTTLGRSCQFCNTPLGDDERICPICGRIN